MEGSHLLKHLRVGAEVDSAGLVAAAHATCLMLQVKKENSEATFGEIGKLIGKKWKEISASDKTKYEEMAKKDKVRAPVQAGSPWLCPPQEHTHANHGVLASMGHTLWLRHSREARFHGCPQPLAICYSCYLWSPCCTLRHILSTPVDAAVVQIGNALAHCSCVRNKYRVCLACDGWQHACGAGSVWPVTAGSVHAGQHLSGL